MAERRLFEVIRQQLGPDWTAMHSVGLAVHATKPWAEIDFVLVGPPGLFCLEVKGGLVERKAGRWRFGDSVKNEGPFEQVGGAAAALRNYLVDQLPSLNAAMVCYGVITPDITFAFEGPDVIPDAVYDISDASRPFDTYMDRLTRFWRDRLQAMRKSVRPLSKDDCRRIVETIRGDFDLIRSLRTRADVINSELVRLTVEQYRVLDELADNARVLVRGGAGTGKTLLGVEEARRRAAGAERVFFCCFNRALAESVEAMLSGDELVKVSTLHKYMAKSVHDAGLDSRLPRVEEDDLLTVHYPRISLEALLELEELGSYDVLIVDELQDLLLPAYLDVLDALLKNGLAQGQWKMFMDPHQDIFGSIGPDAFNRLLACGPAQCRLTVNCRNTQPIATTVALLSSVQGEAALVEDGPEVVHTWYRNAGDQRRAVTNSLNRLLSGGLRPPDIVILSPRRFDSSDLCAGVRFPVRVVDMTSHRQRGRIDGVRYYTIGAFKGLEADAVLLVDIDRLGSEAGRLWTYVGCSRAKVFLEVFLKEDQREAYAALAAALGRSLAGRERTRDGGAE
jgi:hypothetical protein